MKSSIAVLILLGLSLSVYGMDEVDDFELEPPPYDHPSDQQPTEIGPSELSFVPDTYENIHYEVQDDENQTASLIESTDDIKRSSLAHQFFKSIYRSKKIIGGCCAALTCGGIIVSSVLGGMKVFRNSNDCPPFTWNRTNAPYEPCGIEARMLAPACQVQWAESSCIPVFQEPTTSHYYRVYGDDKGFRITNDDFMHCGKRWEPLLYAICSERAWEEHARPALCNVYGREANCSFAQSAPEDFTGVTCASEISYWGERFMGVMTPRDYFDEIIDPIIYQLITDDTDLIYSEKCKRMRDRSERIIDQVTMDCSHYPKGASPRTHPSHSEFVGLQTCPPF